MPPLLLLPLLMLLVGAGTASQAQIRIAPIRSIGDTVTCHVGGKRYQLRPDHSLISAKNFAANTVEVQKVFDKVSRYTNLRINLYTVPVENDINVEICPGDVNYIAYNAAWIKALYRDTDAQWALYGVIAHEVGHYALNHDRTEIGSDPEIEIAADEYAGGVLAKMCSSLQEAQSAYNSKIMQEQPGDSHPPSVKRLAAVERGWNKFRSSCSSAGTSPTSTHEATRAPAERVTVGTTGYIKGLDGRLNPILDSLNRTYLYADNIAIEGGRTQPVAFKPNQPLVVEDSLGNRFELNVVPIDSDSSTIEYRRLASAADRERATLNLKVVDQNSRPIRGAAVFAIFSDGTHLQGRTDSQGVARIQNLKQRSITLYCAHQDYAAFYKEGHDADSDPVIELEAEASKGSIIIDSTGYIPGLEGRLNPKLDEGNRTYLYADKISIENGTKQPTAFRLGQPFQVEDGRGKRFELKVISMIAATALIEYTRLN
ncbi:MAG: hypothetical protein ABW007_11475 [Chitinophagaceae bacterium]